MQDFTNNEHIETCDNHEAIVGAGYVPVDGSEYTYYTKGDITLNVDGEAYIISSTFKTKYDAIGFISFSSTNFAYLQFFESEINKGSLTTKA